MPATLKHYRERLRLYKRYGYDMVHAREFILDKTGITSGRILEIGTGKGHLAVALSQRGMKFVTIDVDRASQALAKTNLNAMRLGSFAEFRVMDAERLRYPTEAFDYAIAVNFIHHSENPAKCLQEMVRVTKRRLVVADLNQRGSRILDRVHRLDGRRHERSKVSMEEVRTLLQRHGMAVKTFRDRCQYVLVAQKGGAK